MKKTITFLSILTYLTFATTSEAQSTAPGEKQEIKNDPAFRTYFGINTGINNHNGLLGISVDEPFYGNYSGGLGLGISSWGWKFFIEGRYYFNERYRGWAAGTGLTYSVGPGEADVETTHAAKENVQLECKGSFNIAWSVYRFWTMGKGTNRFYLQLGFSIPVYKGPYSIKNSYPLTEKGERDLKRRMPGGYIIGIGMYIH